MCLIILKDGLNKYSKSIWSHFLRLWYLRILSEIYLTSSETIEFGNLNVGVVQLSKTSIPSYYTIFRY
ncbi:hypothetical protein CN404_20270 [Bacillus thuringiensis]|uniref:SpoVR family protein n=1 Tax=Bacillus thuringiensis TaxID=1428 RepID=A0A9X6TWR7_BACTU|nr:hypothetical protein ICE_00051 [Bacillus cereus BAG1X1-2]EJV76418.1 hypothetical protein IGE_04783 [Bacillus cereus HuB1-1]EPF08439.1 hypothetical protein ICA_05668 [Bacillus cereus BAG1O-3]MDR4415300.1 SpoVR family protein [Bacillus thuringiensis]OTW55967.1 hypothetical protein BK703_15470 [Bacillus thuringiensis serovar silo]OTW61549.1 hypothetical protein BK700_21155 [Bacillus thuringiensis serovar toguchini]